MLAAHYKPYQPAWLEWAGLAVGALFAIIKLIIMFTEKDR